LAEDESAATVAKTLAEAKRIKNEAEKLSIEMEELRSAAVENVSQAASFAASATEAVVLYDSRSGFEIFDFRQEREDGAEAVVTSKDGTLNIERRNTEGRFLLWLESYTVSGNRVKLLPRREDVDGQRKIRVQCQVRAASAEHTVLLRIVAKDALTGDHLARWRERVRPTEWVTIDWYLQIPAGEDSFFRIEDRSAAKPSDIQIRNLVITERARD
jgi:hypothetical protein